MSKQHWVSRRVGDPSTSTTNYSNILQPSATSATEADELVEAALATTVSKLVVTLGVAPGSGKSWTFTLRKNGADTGLTCTISDTATTASDLVNTVSYAVGDTLTLKIVPSGTPTAPSGVYVALQSNSTTAKESGYGFGRSSLSASAVRYNAPFAGGDWATSATPQLVGAAGTIDHIRFTLSAAPGVGKSFAFVLYLNGVKQDGAGGTTTTTCTISDAATSGNASFSLAVAAGDEVYLECTPSGTPTAGTCRGAVRFTATTDGESQFCGLSLAAPSASATNYIFPNFLGPSVSNWNATETLRDVVGSSDGFTLSKLRLKLTTAPGGGKSYAFALRKNTAASGLGVTISDANTTGSDLSNWASFTSTDKASFQSVPSGTPASTGVLAWAMVQTDGTSDPGATGHPASKRMAWVPFGAHGKLPRASVRGV